MPHEMAVFVRSEAELARAGAAAGRAGLLFKILDENVGTADGHVSIGTMHLAKGLEFRAAAVRACDDEVIPSRERHLLYVACTRARDHLLVTGSKPASELLDDLKK